MIVILIMIGKILLILQYLQFQLPLLKVEVEPNLNLTKSPTVKFFTGLAKIPYILKPVDKYS